jgi:tetratricopeptide (TPR) repeat protein
MQGWLRMFLSRAALGLCFVTFHAVAQDAPPPPGEDLYVQGLGWMARNELHRARDLMEQAIALNPNNAGARMDLSLIYCQLGEVAKANDMWAEIETRFNPPAPLVEVIRQERLHGCVLAQSAAEFEVEVARGHSSNINQGVKSLSLDIPTVSGLLPVQLLPQFGQTADSYTQFNSAFKSAVTEGGVQAQISVQARENDQIKNLNILATALDVAKRQETEAGRLDWIAGLGQANLGGSVFQRHTKLRVNLRPNQQPIAGWDSIFGLGVSQIDYPAFETMSSRPVDVQVMMVREWTGSRLEVYGQLSKDRGDANRPGGDKDGKRWGLNLVQALGQVHEERLFAKLGWEVQSWQSVRAYSPGFIEEPRQQWMSTAVAAIVWPQTRADIWTLEARRQRNHENIQIFEYQATTFQLGYRKIWGQ